MGRHVWHLRFVEVPAAGGLALDWTAETIFLALAAFIQFALGLAILIRRARVEWAIVLALIFFGNSALALNTLLSNLFVSWTSSVAERVFYDFDRTTTLLILYLALAYPRRPKWATRPWILPVLFLGVWGSVVLPPLWDVPFTLPLDPALQPPECQGACTRGTFLSAWAYQITTVGFLVLLIRWAYLLPRLASPVEVTHLRLLFAAFAVRAVHVELLIYRSGPFSLIGDPNSLLAADPWPWVYYIRGALALVLIPLAAFLLLRKRNSLPTETRRAVDFVLVFFLIGALEAVVNGNEPLFGRAGKTFQYAFESTFHLDVLVLRPILIVFAMLRYDFLGPWANRRRAVAGLAAGLGTVGFVTGIHPVLIDIHNELLRWVASIAVALALSILTVALLLPYLGPPRSTAIGQYLGLLEDAHRNRMPTSEQLERLERDRVRLGIDASEGHALQEAVAGRWQGDSAWLPGQRIAGRYQLVRLLAVGGWGEIYLADDLIDGTSVVLKRTRSLNPIERKSILAESYALTKLSHPNLVPLLRTDLVQGEPVLVLKHMAGGSLATRLQQGPLSERELHDVATGMLQALAAVHEAGLVHADVKPGNLLFDEAGVVHLGDFGLAQPVEPLRRLGDPTPSHRPAGSTRYLAPEQARGGPPSKAADLYAAGMVLLECKTGQHPIASSLPEYEQRKQVAENPLRLGSEIGPWRKLLTALLQRNPMDRPTARRALLLLPGDTG